MFTEADGLFDVGLGEIQGGYEIGKLSDYSELRLVVEFCHFSCL